MNLADFASFRCSKTKTDGMKRIWVFFLPLVAAAQGYTSYFTGNVANVATQPSFGVCLMGGATEHDNAMKWLLQQADGGDVVVLRATGSDGYNDYLYSELGINVNSVETLVITSVAGATNPYVLNKVANAEMIWLAGGDQYNYVSFFRDNALGHLLNEHVAVKHYPIGGTSAGMAVLGGYYFSAQNGSITSATATSNPYASNMTIGAGDFMTVPFLESVITDTHFDNPDRRGRLSAFMARITQDYDVRSFGIACNEYVAVCVDETGLARVYGDYPNYQEFAYFVQSGCSGDFGPELCSAGQPLTWNYEGTALKVYRVPGTMTGQHYFKLNDWQTGSGGTWLHWKVTDGAFLQTSGTPTTCALSVGEEEVPMAELYPNPFGDVLAIEMAGAEPGEIKAYSMLGRLVYQGRTQGTANLDTTSWPSGLYIIELSDARGVTRYKMLRD